MGDTVFLFVGGPSSHFSMTRKELEDINAELAQLPSTYDELSLGTPRICLARDEEELHLPITHYDLEGTLMTHRVDLKELKLAWFKKPQYTYPDPIFYSEHVIKGTCVTMRKWHDKRHDFKDLILQWDDRFKFILKEVIWKPLLNLVLPWRDAT